MKLDNEQVVLNPEEKFINDSSEEDAKVDNSSTPGEDFSYSSSYRYFTISWSVWILYYYPLPLLFIIWIVP